MYNRQLYNSTDGDNWIGNTNWLTDEPIDNWVGITVEDGRVTKIRFACNLLVGSLPSSIGNLSQLKEIYFSNWAGGCNKDSNYNEISGSFPVEFFNLTNLQIMDFRQNKMSGSIPSEFDNLQNLKVLDLFSNDLSGNIPVEIYSLTNLATLNFEQNWNITGSISSQIGNLINLEELSLTYNKISGNIPSEIGNLTKLRIFTADHNNISGSIPTEIGNLTNLTLLYLYLNELTGNIPSSIGNLINLEYLYLGGNNLTGNIPQEMGNLTKLDWFSLSANNLDGEISPEIGNLTNMRLCYLDRNQFSGNIPTQINNLSNLQHLSIYDNKLSSCSDLRDLSQLGRLWIYNNSLEFDDIEPNLDVAVGDFTYSPQDSVSYIKFDSVCEGEPYTLSITVGGAYNLYLWFKDGSAISSISPDSTYTIASVTEADTGAYFCEITNTLATELTLHGRPRILHLKQNPDPQISGSNSVCANNIESYFSNITSEIEYEWTTSGGTIGS